MYICKIDCINYNLFQTGFLYLISSAMGPAEIFTHNEQGVLIFQNQICKISKSFKKLGLFFFYMNLQTQFESLQADRKWNISLYKVDESKFYCK